VAEDTRADDLLRYVRENAASLRQHENCDPVDVAVSARALVNVLEALERHITEGGELPRAWRPYQCSQAPHPGIEFYGLTGGCAECGYRPGLEARDV
jgi:hypothetical protein